MKKISFNVHDFGMFDGELDVLEYEFFLKHTGAFKRMMQDEPREQKQRFLDAFCDFFLNYGELTSISITSPQSEHKKKFVNTFKQYGEETFVKGKYSSSKQFVNDAFVVSRNKHMVQFMDSQSYAKDPFFHKETREVFRRLFGEPSESGTCVKVICLLPLYARFAGAMCRYLRRWLDANEEKPVSAKPTKRKTKEEEEEGLKAAQTGRTKKPSRFKATGDGSKKDMSAQTIMTSLAGDTGQLGKTHGCDMKEKGKTEKQKTTKINGEKHTEVNNGHSEDVGRCCKNEELRAKRLSGDTRTKTSSKETTQGRNAKKTTVSSHESSSDDEVIDDEYIQKTFPELHLGEPHPNKVYENMVRGRIVKKLHSCAFCKMLEKKPKMYKKCAKCKGKGTRFYCGPSCQRKDWPTHQFQHQN